MKNNNFVLAGNKFNHSVINPNEGSHNNNDEYDINKSSGDDDDKA